MKRVWIVLALLGTAAGAHAQAAKAPPPIQDNSFLIEEAYNQETGVVQHISTLSFDRGSRAWEYTFTQEWPLLSQKHQLSFTLPVQRDELGAGIGDLALNYRYQLMGDGDSPLAVSPRLTLMLPTGDVGRGRGVGNPGVQVNLPASLVVGPRLVTHANVGATYARAARNPAGQEATTADYNLGGSVIWLTRPAFNLMLETLWESTEQVDGPGATARTNGLYVSPGVRGAINFPSGLQIVPGLAIPIGVGSNSGERSVFLYLSLEHPFTRQTR